MIQKVENFFSKPLYANPLKCFDTEGSYQCQCIVGYKGDGRNCVRKPFEIFFERENQIECFQSPNSDLKICDCAAGYEAKEVVQAIDFDFPMLKCFDIDECRDGEINTFLI